MDIREMIVGELYTLAVASGLWPEPRVTNPFGPNIPAGEQVMFLGEVDGDDLRGKPMYARVLTSFGPGWMHKTAFVQSVRGPKGVVD